MDASELALGVEAATSLTSLALPSADLAKSPSSSEFLGDEEARSTCPLLTPSPPAGAFLPVFMLFAHIFAISVGIIINKTNILSVAAR